MLCLGKKCSCLNKGCVLQFIEDTFRSYQASNIQFSFKFHLLETIKRHETTELEVHINVRPEINLSDRNEMRHVTPEPDNPLWALNSHINHHKNDSKRDQYCGFGF